MKKENDILEKTLDIAESGYDNAYQFLLEVYKNAPENYGPQTLYFLSCLAGGAGMPEKALRWLKYAIINKGWWYRPEILEDDDLELLENNSEFISLKSISNDRYTAAVAKTKSLFSWKKNVLIICFWLFMGIHKTVKLHVGIGCQSLKMISCGRWKPYKVLNRMDTEHIVGVMIWFPIFR